MAMVVNQINLLCSVTMSLDRHRTKLDRKRLHSKNVAVRLDKINSLTKSQNRSHLKRQVQDHIKQPETQRTWCKACRRIIKTNSSFFCQDLQKHQKRTRVDRESRRNNTGHANTTPLPLRWHFQSNIRTKLHTKSYTYYHCPNDVKTSPHRATLRSCTGRIHGGLQTESLSIIEEVHTDILGITSCFLLDCSWDVVAIILIKDLKQMGRLFHIILLPQGQAVKLLQRHSKHLLKLIRR